MPSADGAAPKRKRPPRERILGWVSVSMWGFAAEARGKRLVVMVGGDRGAFSVVALEYESTASTPESIFAAHSHKAVGEYPELRDAMREAEDYARRWFLQGPLVEKPCDCGEIPDSTEAALKSAAEVVTK